VILATAFCVNLRFMVFSAHLRAYMMDLGRGDRMLRGYLTADLSYVLFTKRHPHPAPDAAGRRHQLRHLAGSCALGWVFWIAPSLAGIAFAHAIPAAWGLHFAGILALLGVLCSLASTRLRALAALLSGAAAVAAYALPLKLNILVGIAVAVGVCMSLEKTHLPARKGQDA
jgi:predicted branched-subunit amino acid permease